MLHTESSKKKSNPYLPNIRYTSQNETDFSVNQYSKETNQSNNFKFNNLNNYEKYEKKSFKLYNDYNENNISSINEQLTGRNDYINNKIIINDEIERAKNFNKVLPNVYRSKDIDKNKEKYFLKKNYSQIELGNNKYNINNSNENKNNELSNFKGKIKILNFYSTSEIILLIENIISELNLKKDYTFSVKDSSMSFTFNDAEQAIHIFKRINLEKLKNKYYRNLIIDIKFEIKDKKEEIKDEIIEKINEEIKKEKKIGKMRKFKVKNLSLVQLKIKKKNDLNKNKIGKLKNLRTYNYSKDNLLTNNISDKNFEEIYKNYINYFNQRREERRKRELNYKNGKEISLLASSPFIENNNRKSFEENLRNNGGNDISPSKFNGFIDKASIKKENYKENHLYEVPDFINHWKLREENKDKFIGPSKFQV